MSRGQGIKPFWPFYLATAFFCPLARYFPRPGVLWPLLLALVWVWFWVFLGNSEPQGLLPLVFFSVGVRLAGNSAGQRSPDMKRVFLRRYISVSQNKNRQQKHPSWPILYSSFAQIHPAGGKLSVASPGTVAGTAMTRRAAGSAPRPGRRNITARWPPSRSARWNTSRCSPASRRSATAANAAGRSSRQRSRRRAGGPLSRRRRRRC